MLLMGSAEFVVEPKTKTVFLEDLPPDEAAKTGMTLPAGLINLGNTCYMNSTLQVSESPRASASASPFEEDRATGLKLTFIFHSICGGGPLFASLRSDPPQCLRACPSFRQGLKAFNAVPTDANSSFVNALKRTMEGVDSSVEAIPPVQVSEAKRSEASEPRGRRVEPLLN